MILILMKFIMCIKSRPTWSDNARSRHFMLKKTMIGFAATYHHQPTYRVELAKKSPLRKITDGSLPWAPKGLTSRIENEWVSKTPAEFRGSLDSEAYTPTTQNLAAAAGPASSLA